MLENSGKFVEFEAPNLCTDFGRRNAGNCILDNYIYVYGGYEFDDQVDGIERLDVRKFIHEGGEISRWEMMLKSSLRCFGKPIMAPVYDQNQIFIFSCTTDSDYQSDSFFLKPKREFISKTIGAARQDITQCFRSVWKYKMLKSKAYATK